MASERECSVGNPCEEGTCNLDRGVCGDDSTVVTIYVKGESFTGKAKTLKKKLRRYFDRKMKT